MTLRIVFAETNEEVSAAFESALRAGVFSLDPTARHYAGKYELQFSLRLEQPQREYDRD